MQGDLLQHNITEKNLHRLTGMQLQGKESFLPPFSLIIVDKFSRFHPIDVLVEMKIFCSNTVLIPFPFFNRLSNLNGIPEFRYIFF